MAIIPQQILHNQLAHTMFGRCENRFDRIVDWKQG